MKRESKDLINFAYKNGFAIPAINVSNLETIMGTFEAADSLNSPIILQISPIQLEMQHLTFNLSIKLIDLVATVFPNVHYSIHLDHASSYHLCAEAVQQGFQSIMFDGSSLDFIKNLEITDRLRRNFKKISLEGELGTFERAEGKNEEVTNESHLTDPEEALEFVRKTNVDFLAISFGNNHGFYKKEPDLDFDRLHTINKLVNVPLVLHGGTGISMLDIHKSIELGIAKINFFTQCDNAYNRGFINDSEDGDYMMKRTNNAQRSFADCVRHCIYLCKSKGELYG